MSVRGRFTLLYTCHVCGRTSVGARWHVHSYTFVQTQGYGCRIVSLRTYKRKPTDVQSWAHKCRNVRLRTYAREAFFFVFAMFSQESRQVSACLFPTAKLRVSPYETRSFKLRNFWGTTKSGSSPDWHLKEMPCLQDCETAPAWVGTLVGSEMAWECTAISSGWLRDAFGMRTKLQKSSL